MITKAELEAIRKLLRNSGAIQKTTTPPIFQELASTLDFVTVEVALAALTSKDLPLWTGNYRGEKRQEHKAEFTAFLQKIADAIASGAMPRPQLPPAIPGAHTATREARAHLESILAASKPPPANQAGLGELDGPVQPTQDAPKSEPSQPSAAIIPALALPIPPEARDEWARLTVKLPMDVFMKLKVKAVLKRTTITKMVADLVKRLV